MTTATELDNLPTDIDVAGPEEYIDGGPELVPEATYDLLVKEYEVGRDRETGEFRNYIRIRRAVISGGEYDGRFVNDLMIFTTPYLRRGVKVSGLGDFLRGIDDAASWSGLPEACSLLDRAIDQNIPIRTKLNWEAFDRSGFESEGGQRMVRKSQEEKDLRQRATVKYMRNFPQLPDGSHRSQVPGPISGELLEARLTIDRVIPSSKVRR